MGGFVKGDVVVVPFPFSDFSSSKRRPALVVTDLKGDDLILCQITTRDRGDGYSIPLTQADFASGNLRHDCNIRPNRLFRADSNIIAYRAGKVSQQKITEVVEEVIAIIRS